MRTILTQNRRPIFGIVCALTVGPPTERHLEAPPTWPVELVAREHERARAGGSAQVEAHPILGVARARAERGLVQPLRRY